MFIGKSKTRKFNTDRITDDTFWTVVYRKIDDGDAARLFQKT